MTTLIARVLNGPRMFFGEKLNEIINQLNALSSNGANGGSTAGAGAFTTLSATSGITTTGAVNRTITTVAAAGASQGNATAIAATAAVVLVTVTASTEGVKLPTAVAGQQIQVMVPGTVGVKVYPAAGAAIDAGSSNAAQALAAGKSNIFTATSTTAWKTLKGA